MKEAKDRRSYERFQSVYLSLKGYTQREIADIMGRCVKTIHHYVSAYR
ncbi:helix-turn-helix domain-containing protein [Aneurinibacillus tyrosinisolvens]